MKITPKIGLKIEKQALRARIRVFWAFFAIFGAFRHENSTKIVEQSGPGYDPQAAVMRWLPLATIAILTPGGSILTRDVRNDNNDPE